MTTPPPILFADPRYVVLNKPAGLPVHAGPQAGPTVEDWFPALSRRRDGPWLAHRLDADTAGCLVVALRRAALLAAQTAFASGSATKTYWAITRGAPPAESGRIERKLAKRSNKAGWHMVAASDGAAAVSDWRVLGQSGGRSWIEIHPRTGRTHQVRAHLALLGCPVLGDPVYGSGDAGGIRLNLLARAISLPVDPVLQATAPPPPHMLANLTDCGWADPPNPE